MTPAFRDVFTSVAKFDIGLGWSVARLEQYVCSRLAPLEFSEVFFAVKSRNREVSDGETTRQPHGT